MLLNDSEIHDGGSKMAGVMTLFDVIWSHRHEKRHDVVEKGQGYLMKGKIFGVLLQKEIREWGFYQHPLYYGRVKWLACTSEG